MYAIKCLNNGKFLRKTIYTWFSIDCLFIFAKTGQFKYTKKKTINEIFTKVRAVESKLYTRLSDAKWAIRQFKSWNVRVKIVEV